VSRRSALCRIWNHVWITSLALGLACLQSTEPRPSTLQLDGTWHYAGIQTGESAQTLTGTLTISNQSGSSFQGRLDIVSVDARTGQPTPLSGVVSGAESSSGVVDFDARLEVLRRHVGQVVADTISGTWIGEVGNGTVSSGTFRAERQSR
jgi:hypothetical protein